MIRRFAVRLTACTCLASGIAHAAAEPPADPGDIVVTATRRAAPLQRVPISVSAYDQKSMDAKGVRDIADLARFTPGVTFDPSNNQIAIRGVISNAGAGATGIYIDDTPIQMRAIGFASDDTLPAIFDLERVEILRGPQGTLFGAGSEGGTVRYITPQPSLSKLSSYARAEVASTAHGGMSYEAGGAIGAPIIDGALGFRLSAWHRRDGGWVDRVDNDTHVVTKKNANYADTTAIAGALTWAPTDWLSLTPSMRYQKRERNDTDEYWVGISDPKHGKFRNGSPDERHSPDRFILPALKVEAKLGFARLISNTSWYDRRQIGSYDGTVYNLSYYQQFGSPYDPLLIETGINPDLPFYLAPARVLNRQRSFTQEVRLEGGRPGDKLQWTIGLFYQNNRQKSVERIADPDIDTLFNFLFGQNVEEVLGGPLYQGRYSYISNTRSREHHLAVFGQASYEVLPGLTAIAGLRYEKLRFKFKNFTDGPQNGGRAESSGGDKASPATPKLGLSYQVNRDNMIYATWSRGYRAGGATPPVPTDVCADDLNAFGIDSTPSSFSADKVSSFEIGAKSNLFNRRLQIAASVYQLNWHNIQQYVLLPSCGFKYTDNVGNARVRGFEIQATLRPLEGLSIDATAGYTDARFTTNGHPTGSSTDAVISRRGNTLGGAPWTATLGAQYEARLGAKTAYLRGDLRYQSANRRRVATQDPGTVIYDPGTFQPSALTEVSLRAGVRWQSLDLSLFVDNLFDATPRLLREHMDSDTLLYTESTLQPRTFGVTLSHRY